MERTPGGSGHGIRRSAAWAGGVRPPRSPPRPHPPHVRLGALSRERTALERDGIIGWVIQQTYFQRRRGLATLVATTAAGGEKVEVTDVRLPVAVALADEATPGLLTPFRAD
ncbi:MAG: PH domain-containing protein [Nocardioides sp.]